MSIATFPPSIVDTWSSLPAAAAASFLFDLDGI
jgi:hypothetical protein